jgi:tRNA (mo5U34)-methyltransferase
MAHAMRRSRVEHRFCSVYELSPYALGTTFDVVFCGSLLLHLQNPLIALHNIRSVTREMAIIETTIDRELEEKFPGRPFVSFGSVAEENEPGEHNVFWAMTTAGLQRMLRYADFARVEPQGIFDLGPNGPTATSVIAYVKA